MKFRSIVLSFVIFLMGAAPALALEPVTLHWVDQTAPAASLGSAFGVPFSPGDVKKADAFSITAGDVVLPLQSWPLAYWPDGSIKWEGFAVPASNAKTFTLTVGQTQLPAMPVQVNEDAQAVTITTGGATWRIPRSGSQFVESISMNNHPVAAAGTLVALEEDRSQAGQHITREIDFASRINAVTVEQRGPVRAVVKIEGVHANADRAWLAFTLRLYFYEGNASVKLVHSFIFDGDQEKDFIKGLGVRFNVPLREAPYNRHVRFAGDEGLFEEPVQPIVGRRVGPQAAMGEVQGQPLINPQNANLIEQMAIWDSYKLTQLSPDGYEIDKQTNPQSAPIRSLAGRRSRGTVFLGDTRGGLAMGLKNFWQMYPTSMEISGASTSNGQVTMWLWSPDAPAMDMRHYDTKEHGLDAAYEDITPGYSTATGIARTHEILLTPFASVPAAAQLNGLANATMKTPQLVCTPQYYHDRHAFGVWSLPDRSTPAKKTIEDALDAALAFYQGQVEARQWYSFWDYGDFMHSYDESRHEWRYDIGGYAWSNTELMPDMWLWYSFLRSGRADIFRMAEAMTRETQEVDVYHTGPMKGLGSRHNVRHWGDGAKELRVSEAALKRFYYYLTTDERTGDLMNEVIDADQALLTVDPLRKLPGIAEDKAHPTHLRAGPDWFALCSDWLTAWERTGDPKYLAYVKTGIESFYAMPKKLFNGENYGYDPATKKIYPLTGTVGVPHLAALMGGPEMWMEFTPVINDPHWTEMWMQYCQFLQAPRDELQAALGGNISSDRLGFSFAKMTGYAAKFSDDPALRQKLAERAWSEFLGRSGYAGVTARFTPRMVLPPIVPIPVQELPTTGTGSLTNETSQWSLNAIELLDLVGDKMPQPN